MSAARVLGGLLLSGLVLAASTRAAEAGKAPNGAHTPGTKVWRDCPVCSAALEKAMQFILKEIQTKSPKVNWYSGMLGGLSCGYALMMMGGHEKELEFLIGRQREYMTTMSRVEGMNGYRNWFISITAMTIAEYSVRYGLTPENAAALDYAHQYAIENIDDSGGWFHHPRHGGSNYASDISMIGCFYYTAFHEMEALGLTVEPGLTMARGYLDSISDGRTIAYGTPSRKGGDGSAGKNGWVLSGLFASGRENDPLVKSYGAWLSANVDKPYRGHATGLYHYLGAAVGLHRMGPEAYGRFAEFWLHRLIECQCADGSLPKLPHDCKDLDGELAKLKGQESGDWATTGILACLILLTDHGTFAKYPHVKKDPSDPRSPPGLSSGSTAGRTPTATVPTPNTPAKSATSTAAGTVPSAPTNEKRMQLKDPKQLDLWKDHVRERIMAVAKAGTSLKCNLGVSKGEITVLSASDNGPKVRLSDGAQMDMSWTMLSDDDMGLFAIQLAKTTDAPGDHALAAFYHLHKSAREMADEHLVRAGDEAAPVKAAFGLE